jgi:hypothetical protein
MERSISEASGRARTPKIKPKAMILCLYDFTVKLPEKGFKKDPILYIVIGRPV